MLEPGSWRFLSYVARDRCVITDWLNRLSPRASAAFQVRLTFLRPTVLWKKPYYAPLKGKKFKGLGEIRYEADNVQYRVIGFQRANKEFVMLIGCTHKQSVYDPPSALTTAATRMDEVKEGKAEVRDYESECSEEA